MQRAGKHFRGWRCSTSGVGVWKDWDRLEGCWRETTIEFLGRLPDYPFMSKETAQTAFLIKCQADLY